MPVFLCRAVAEPVISEFVASNETGLADEEREKGDWIEIYNETGTVSLSGWHLTDSRDDRAKWTFPAVMLGPRQAVVVFASGKNRSVAGQVLHTNFKLSSSGGYLALTRPDRTVATEFDPYPAQFGDRSYGTAQVVSRTDFLTGTAAVKWKVPADNALGTAWTQRGFDDGGWTPGTSGLGYEPSFAGFAVKAVQATVPVTSLSGAETVLSTPGQQGEMASANAAVVDLWNSGATGRYGGNAQPPGMNGGDVDNMVIECTGTVTIPAAGPRTFGVNSNDGFGLTVGTFTASLPNTTSGAVDSFATFNFPAAGAYPLRLVFFSNTGGAEVELFSAAGTLTSFSAAAFDLIGDTANGGLTVSAPVVNGSNFAPYVSTNTAAAMKGVSASVYARYAFNVAGTGAVTSLTLPVRYDDGCVIYLNGMEIARRNAPTGMLTNLSAALGERSNADAVMAENLDLTPHLGLLVTGANVLAVHGLNMAAGDDDFLLQPELAQISVTTGAVQYFTTPTPGAFNTTPVYNRVSPVVPSVVHGFYTTPFSLTLSTGTTGAEIRYTYDGSTPTAASALFTGPVTINKTTTVRALALKAGSDPSPVLTQTYIFLSDVITQPSTPPVITNPPGSPAATTVWPTGPVNGQRLDYGMDPDIVNAAPWNATIVNDLASVPTLSIVTDLPNLFNASTGIYVNATNNGDAWERRCSMELIYPDGSREGFQQDCGMRIRGNFSRDGNNPKHSLRFFFRDEYGSGKLRYRFFGEDGPAEHDVVDMRTSQDYSWAYLGSYEAHFIGDIFARDLMKQLGQPTTRGAYYHLYINGQYWGLYDSEERINPSFCVQHLGGREEDWDIIKTNAFNIETAAGTDPDYNLLWQKTEAAAITTVAGYMEVQGLNPDGTRNPAFKPLLDPVAMTDYMLMNYAIGNEDGPTFIGGNVVNNYFAVRARNADLPWAYLAHDSEYSFRSLTADITGNYGVGSTYNAANPRRFMERCLLNAEYKVLFADRVQKHFFNGGVLTPARLAATYTVRKDEIDRAVVGESARWGDSAASSPMTREDDWLPRVNYLINTWCVQRPGIVVNQLRTRGYFPSLNAPVFAPQRGGTLAFGTGIALQNPNAAGVVYFTTDGSDPRAIGGEVNTTAQSYSAPLPLNISVIVRARVKDGSTWSPVDEATFYPAQNFGALQLTEIHYNPAPDGAALADDLEFLELKNTGATALDLGGCGFTGGVTFTFPQGYTLAPGAFAVVAKNAAAFAARYPGVTVAGAFTGKLDNGGESLEVSDAAGARILDATYDDDLPWPLAADSYGFSLVPAAGTETGWRASTNGHGSPGTDDPAAARPAVVINEALTNPAASLTDRVELFNAGATAANIGDWWLSDDPAAPRKFRIPAGTVIPPGGYLVFTEADFNAVPGSAASFSYGADGDQCLLVSGNAAGDLTGYSHGFKFAAAEEGVSFGRYVNSAGEESFPRQSNNTPGTLNAGPLTGPVVINEVQYHPAAGEDEYVEIRNLSGAPVDLFFPGDPSNAWRIGGLGYVLPSGTTLAANGYAVLTAADPAAFRAKYNVPAGVPVFGPWGGTLQDSGERLALEKPQSGPAGASLVIPYVVMDAVRYNDKAPWPPAADGSGPSLQRLVSGNYAGEPQNWFASGLTPGRANASNNPPTVSLTGPADGAAHTLPAAVNLTASPADSDGLVRRVEFYSDGGKVGEATAVPWSYAWSGATVGIHTLTARAFDDAGGSADSAAVTLTVNPAPGPISQVVLATGSVWKYRDNGIDPGGGWTAAAYNDNAWLSGPAQLGYGDNDEATQVEDNPTPGYNPADTNRFITTWFRRSFTVPAAAAVNGLTMRFLRDDGIVVHLNGFEVWRDNMGTGAVTAATPATTSISAPAESQFTAVTLPASALTRLVDGTNLLAVEIHQQAADSSDISFDLELTASLTPQPPNITAGPSSRSVFAGSETTFSVTANGPALQYQWRKGGVPIAGATGDTLTIGSAVAGDAGSYSCAVTNYAGGATTGNAVLTVLPLPVLTAAPGQGSVGLSFTAVPSITYELMTSTDLVTWTLLTTITGQSGPQTWTHNDSSVPHRFYRIRVTD